MSAREVATARISQRSDGMPAVLVIALEFAPVQTTGAFRSIDLVRHLPEHGLLPVVVSIEPEEAARIFAAPVNPALLAGLPDGLEVHRLRSEAGTRQETRAAQFLRILTSLDDGFDARFRTQLTPALESIRRRHDIAAIYVSAPPFGACGLGARAAARLGVPWVLDMRDAWSEWGMAPYPTYAHYIARLRDEARAFADADAVVTVTRQLRDIFLATHPGLPRSKMHVVHNGFDGRSFGPGMLTTPEGKDHLDVAYVGSFYYTPPRPMSLLRPHRLLQYRRSKEDWSYRSPLYFFRAWQELERRAPHAARRIRFHHIGSPPAWLVPMAARHGLGDRCKLWGMLPRQELGRALAGMDVMLATSIKRPEGGDYCLASKTFDYLAARKPILAFVAEGAQREFLERSGAALICDPDDTAAAAARMQGLVERGIELELDHAYVNRFSRRETAREMAEIIRSTVRARSGNAGTQPIPSKASAASA